MTQLLIQGAVILAQGPFDMDADSIKTADQVFPKRVIPGWSMVDMELPADFTVAGYEWKGGLVKKPVAPPKPPVPAKVTRRQALQALRLKGITEAQIEAAIDALPLSDMDKDLNIIELKESLEFERSRPIVGMLGPLLQLTADDIDELFIKAATL